MDAANTPDLRKKKWIENFSRFGILSKGVVYCLLGLLAFLASIGSRKEDVSKEGIFKFVLDQPFGKILLAFIAIGLAGYVLWKCLQVLKDTEHQGTTSKGIFARIGYAFSGIIYASMSYYAAKLVLDVARKSDGKEKKFFIQQLLSHAYGSWILGAIGLVVIGQGVNQMYKAIKGKFKRRMHQDKMISEGNSIFNAAGKVGYTSRGIVLGIIGYFVIRAAVYSNSGEIRDTDGAFSYLHSAFGSLAFGLVALGLICYGICMCFMAKYRDI